MPRTRAIRHAGRIDGVLLLQKPCGISSNAALQRARRAFGAERAGHTGTLDPLASGLLVVCLGEATKFSGQLLDADKTYLARIVLGTRTSTGDAEGEILNVRPVSVTRGRLIETLGRFVGAISQRPPMHSAIKRGGRPLYEYARRGISVERLPRTVFVRSLELQGLDQSTAVVLIRCSKGTYVRTLAEDLGEVLGCGAHLGGLLRTAVGRFCVEQAHRLEAVEDATAEDRSGMLLPAHCLLEDLPGVRVDGRTEAEFRNGQPTGPLNIQAGRVRVFGPNDEFLGLGEVDGFGRVHPRRLVLAPAPGGGGPPGGTR